VFAEGLGGRSNAYLRPVSGRISTLSAADLIRQVDQREPEAVVTDLLFAGDVVVIHGYEESFKSILTVQFAENIASGTPFLGRFPIPTPRVVGIINTEIHEGLLGKRLRPMFPKNAPPENLRFLGEDGMKSLRRTRSMEAKLRFVQDWANQEGLEVIVIDVANDFFRGDDNPSDEKHVGSFFDGLRNIPLKARILVRHDRKKKAEDFDIGNSNELIRGSAEWKEDPELIFYVKREDRRTNELYFEVGKFRYGLKPAPCTLWFDAATFRLTPLPPVIAILVDGPQLRESIVEGCRSRFGISRTADDLIKGNKQFLRERMVGHAKEFEIDWERAADAPWGCFLPGGQPQGVAP
jgi:hypothetical protein